jgi:hypothetical protein
VTPCGERAVRTATRQWPLVSLVPLITGTQLITLTTSTVELVWKKKVNGHTTAYSSQVAYCLENTSLSSFVKTGSHWGDVCQVSASRVPRGNQIDQLLHYKSIEYITPWPFIKLYSYMRTLIHTRGQVTHLMVMDSVRYNTKWYMKALLEVLCT